MVSKMEIIRELNSEKSFSSAKDIVQYLDEFRNEDREYFIVIGLDTKNKPIYREIAHIGTANSTLIHPREVFRKAIMMSSVSVIVAHNHPSGDVEPSSEDIKVTKMLKKAGEILEIKLLDHLIISRNDFKSIIGESNE